MRAFAPCVPMLHADSHALCMSKTMFTESLSERVHSTPHCELCVHDVCAFLSYVQVRHAVIANPGFVLPSDLLAAIKEHLNTRNKLVMSVLHTDHKAQYFLQRMKHSCTAVRLLSLPPCMLQHRTECLGAPLCCMLHVASGHPS